MIIKKTPAEIEKMAAAGAVHARAMRLVESKVREGVSTRELDEAVELIERAIPAANERLPRNEDPYEVSRKKRSESAQG